MHSDILEQNDEGKNALLEQLKVDAFEAIMSAPIRALNQGRFRVGADYFTGMFGRNRQQQFRRYVQSDLE